MHNIHTSLEALKTQSSVRCQKLKSRKSKHTNPQMIFKTCHTEAEVRNFFGHSRQRRVQTERTAESREYAAGLNAKRKGLSVADNAIAKNGDDAFTDGACRARVS